MDNLIYFGGVDHSPHPKPPPLYLRTLLKRPYLPSDPSKYSFVASETLSITFVGYTPEHKGLAAPFTFPSYPGLDSKGPGEYPDDHLPLPAIPAPTTTPSQNSYSHQLTPPEESTPHPLALSTVHNSPSAGSLNTTIMVKKRRSLQAIFIPPFLQPATPSESSPTHTTRLRSRSAAAATAHYPLPPPIPIDSTQPASSATSPRNSPPSGLLDDDPFADLTRGPSLINEPPRRARSRSLALPRLFTSLGSPSEPPPPTPRSPLSQIAVPGPSFVRALENASSPSSSQPQVLQPPTPSTPDKKSRSLRGQGQGKVRPAYTRPAFKPGPFLPSLRSLAEGQVATPRVGRGRVGARLPSEPWDSQDSDFSTSESEAPESPRPSHFRRPSNLETIRDSRLFIGDDGLASNDSFEQTPEPLQEEAGSSSVMPTSAPPREDTFSSMARSGVSSFIVPQPLRALSEPITPSRHSVNFGSHSRESSADTISSSGSSSSSTSLSSTSSPTSSPELLSPCDNPYTSILSRRRISRSIEADLTSTLERDYTDALFSLNSSPDLDSVGYSPQTTSDGFEPGTSADTIRSVPIHQRSASNLSETLDWTPTMSGLPLSPTSTLSSDRSSEGLNSYDVSSSGDEFGGCYDRDFISFYSDSSEEHLPSLPLSRSSSSGRDRRMSSFSTTSFSSHSLRTPHNSMYEAEDQGTFDFDEEVADRDVTERISVLFSPDKQNSSHDPSMEEAVDGGEGSGRGDDTRRYNGHSSSHGDYGGWNGGSNDAGAGSWGGGNGSGSGSGGGRRGNDGDDQWNRRPAGRTNVSASKDSDTSEDEDTDDHGEDAPRPARRPTRAPDSDDDVPLAQQIPTALKAQKTIRRQVRDEREHRREERLQRAERAERAERSPAPHTHSFASPERSSHAVDQPEPSVPRDPLRPTTRPRTRTLPSKPTSPFVLQDLTAKLLDVQSSGSGSRSRRPSNEHLPPPSAHRHHGSSSRPSIEAASPRLSKSQQPLDGHLAPPRSPALNAYGNEGVRARNLRPSKSFHRPRTANAEFEHVVPPVPLDPGVKLSRSATTVPKRSRDPQPVYSPPFSPFASTHREEGHSGVERGKPVRATSRGPSFDRSRGPPSDHDNHTRRPAVPRHASAEHSPVPPPPPPPKPDPTWQQRIFIASLQRFHQVEVGASTTAGDLLRTLESQNAFPDGTRKGWMMWEVCQDFGMERPIRSFELLTNVSASWNADKTVNVFMAKKTPLAQTLSRRVIPSSSPICHGQVQHEYKRGKWQKRYLELREHGLWLAKKDTGKDQVFLCSLSNFDAYIVTRVYKAPKSFIFAIKSTDNLSYFENTDDYMHVFSCETRDGVNWLEKILLARSYILHQERNVLSANHATSLAASGTSGAALSRAGTRKHQRPAQPLLNLSTPSTTADATTPFQVFEPGSLLAKRAV